jgi:hypothetical protein
MIGSMTHINQQALRDTQPPSSRDTRIQEVFRLFDLGEINASKLLEFVKV